MTILLWVSLLGVQAHNGIWPPDGITTLSFSNTLKPHNHIKECIQEVVHLLYFHVISSFDSQHHYRMLYNDCHITVSINSIRPVIKKIT